MNKAADISLGQNKKLARNIERIIEAPTFFSVANCFTFIRIFISPIFLFIYLQHDAVGITRIYLPYVLLFLLTVNELSDALDGFLARKYNQVTDLGKILDPMADSISRISIFLTFTQPPVNLPLVLVFVFIYRDSVTSTLRTICALRGFALAARSSGKIKAIIQGVAAFFITLLLIPHSLGKISDESLYMLSTIALFLSASYALYSGIEYVYANRRHIQRILLRKKNNRREYDHSSSSTK